MVDTADFTLPPLFDDLNIGIVVHDPETGAVLDVNETIECQYGYSADELQKMEIGDYVSPSTRFSERNVISRISAAAEGDPQTMECQIICANGELLWSRIHYTTTTIDGIRLVLAEVQEITEYRARERRLRLLSRVIRHNLRNKVTVINGHAERLKSAVEHEALENEAETLLDVASEIGNLSKSVSQIEEIAAPDATQQSPTNARKVIESIADEIRVEYSDVELNVCVLDDIFVVADSGLRYAISHAIENAIEHNDQDVPSVTVTVRDDPENNLATIRVADNGPPIPDNEIEVLKGDVRSSSTYHGTGVGLWVMQWCVNSLGGELTFTENAPRGNVVCLSLPRLDCSEDHR